MAKLMFTADMAKKHSEEHIVSSASMIVEMLMIVIKGVCCKTSNVNVTVGDEYRINKDKEFRNEIIEEVIARLTNLGYTASFHPAKLWSCQAAYKLPDWITYVHKNDSWDVWDRNNKSDTFWVDYFHISWEK